MIRVTPRTSTQPLVPPADAPIIDRSLRRRAPLEVEFVYRLRPFLNSDPPYLAAIWRSQPPQRGVLQPISAPLLEYGVFSKMHFDPLGLIVAEREGTPAGFVHAGFGPNAEGTDLDTSLGTTQMLMIRRDEPAIEGLASELLGASEDYQRSRGATVHYAGGINPLNSFYLGLYGGSEIPGVLQTDSVLRGACAERGYKPTERVSVLQCDLARFRPPVSRELRIIKRTTLFVEIVDPPTKSWWEACVWGSLQRDRFELIDRTNQRTLAYAAFWDMQPLSASWGMGTTGMYDIYVAPDVRRRGYASHLLTEAFRVLQRRGVTSVEVQTMSTNETALAFYAKLGFTEIDHGHVFRKEPSA